MCSNIRITSNSCHLDRNMYMNQFKRLTIPSLAKEATLTRDGLFSKAHFTSQDDVEDQITLDLPAMPYENQWTHQSASQCVVEDQITLGLPAMPYENQWTHQKRHIDASDAFLPGTIPFTPQPTRQNGHVSTNQLGAFLTIPFTPRPTQLDGHINSNRVSVFPAIPSTPRSTQSNGHNGSNGHVNRDQVSMFPMLPSTPRPTQSNGHNGSNNAAFQPVIIPFVPDPQINAIINAIIEKETNHTLWDSLVVSATQPKGKATSKWAFFLELPHLLVYMIGALAIVGLYLIIPLLNLLNATVPGNLNTLLIALGIIVPGELLVCIILARTIPRGKVKKGSVIAQP
jgi:hypothetical protein